MATIPAATNFLDLYSDLQQNIALNLDLENLQNYCKTNPLFLGACRDKNFLERWFKHHYPTFFNDYIRVADAHPELSGFQIVNIVINTVVKVFSFGPDRLSREAGRKVDLTLFRYYMAIHGWSYSAFKNFYLGLIESNKDLPPSLEAIQILNYILAEDNIKEFVFKDFSVRPFHDIRNQIRSYMELYEYAQVYRNLPEEYRYSELPSIIKTMIDEFASTNNFPESFEIKRINFEESIRYLAKLGLILDSYQSSQLMPDEMRKSIYLNNLNGLMEAGKYEEALHSYIPHTGGVLRESDFYNYLLIAFEEHSIIYYSRDNLNNFLDFIISSKSHYGYLFATEDTEVLRKLLISAETREVSPYYTKHINNNLFSIGLISEFPFKINFNSTNYLSRYLNRMTHSFHLGLVLNNMILLKLIELFPDRIKSLLSTALLSTGLYNNVFEINNRDLRLTLRALKVVDDEIQNLIV